MWRWRPRKCLVKSCIVIVAGAATSFMVHLVLPRAPNSPQGVAVPRPLQTHTTQEMAVAAGDRGGIPTMSYVGQSRASVFRALGFSTSQADGWEQFEALDETKYRMLFSNGVVIAADKIELPLKLRRERQAQLVARAQLFWALEQVGPLSTQLLARYVGQDCFQMYTLIGPAALCEAGEWTYESPNWSRSVSIMFARGHVTDIKLRPRVR